LLAALRALHAARARGLFEPFELSNERREILELVVAGEGARLAVTSRIVPWPEEVELPENEPDLLSSLPRLESRWFAELLPHPGQFAGDPRRIQVFLLVDLDREAVVTFSTVGEGDLRQAAETLVSTVVGANEVEPGLPKELLCRDSDLRDVLDVSLAGTELVPTLAELPPAVERIVAELTKAFAAMKADHDEGRRPTSRDNWRQLLSSLSSQLILISQEKRHDVAVQRYFGKRQLGYELLEEQDPAVIASFLEWRIFDHRPGQDVSTLAEEFAASDKATGPEREAIASRAAATLSIFRVDRWLEAHLLEAVDLVSGKRHELVPLELGLDLSAGDMIPLRTFALDGTTFATAAGPRVPSSRILTVLERFEAALQSAGGEPHPGATLLGRLYGEWADEEEREPALTNTDGDPLEPVRATFHVASQDALLAALLRRDDFDLVAPDRWKHFRGLPGKKERLLLASLGLQGDELEFEVNSDRRYQLLRAELTKIPGVTFRTNEWLEPPSAFATHRARGPVGRDEIAALESTLSAHYRTWPDTALPALEDHTPREAVQLQPLRRRVFHLIQSMPPVLSPTGPLQPPREALLAELGFSP
jgi:hypothetical protein